MTAPRSNETPRPAATLPFPTSTGPSSTVSPGGVASLSGAKSPSERARDIGELEADADEIEAYFSSLMERISGTNNSNPAAAKGRSPPLRVLPAPPGSPAQAPAATLTLGSAAGLSMSPAIGDLAFDRGPKELPPPRAVAENLANLHVMRDVANVHWREAVEKFDCRSLKQRAIRLWFVTLILNVTALFLALASQVVGGTMGYLASLIAAAVAVACLVNYFRMVSGFRRHVEQLVRESSGIVASVGAGERSRE